MNTDAAASEADTTAAVVTEDPGPTPTLPEGADYGGHTVTFLTLTNSFKMFDQNMALTGGMPSIIVDKAKVNVTELLALNIYSTYNINKNWHGVAQAKAVIFFILVAVLAIAQQYVTGSKEVEQ